MRPVKVLIVEDEAMTAMLLQRIVSQLNLVPMDIVVRGEDAISFVKENKPDLILMDIQLAGDIDGIETAEQIRKNSDIPIIFATAFSNPEIIERAKKTNPAAYLIKPVTRSELSAAISALL